MYEKKSDKKRLIENFSYLGLLQIACYIFPLLTIPYLAKTIGAEGFGKIAFSLAIVNWLQIIVDWGFNYTATRDIAKNSENRAFVSRVFSDVFWSKCLISLICLFVLFVLFLSFSDFRGYAVVILITYAMVPGNIFLSSWFFQALEKMKFVAIFNFIIKLLFTISAFTFINEPDDYIFQPLFISLGFLLCGIVSMWIIIKRWGYSLYKPDFRNLLSEIICSKDVFFNNLMLNSYTNFSVFLLGFFGGSRANGIFDGGNKFVVIFQQFLQVVSRVFFPFLSRKLEKHSYFACLNIVISLFFSLFLYIMAPYFVDFFLSADFGDSIIVMRILAISIPFVALNNTYGINYLIIVKKERLLRNVTIFSSFLGIFVAYPLISSYSYLGAAITVFISRFFLGVLTCFFAVKEKCKKRG